MPSYKEVLTQAATRLADLRIDNPKLDARLLLGAATGFGRAELLLKQDEEIGANDLLVFASLIDRRQAREPVGRILGVREFYGLPFRLNAGTLEPRPDSETLIEAVLHELDDRQAAYRILDLGTGTGCLLAALLSVLPNASGLGVDKNPLAVEAARGNLAELGFDDRAKVIEGDWASGIDEQFDIVISNPPYIRSGEMPDLEPEVTQYDPELALVAGADGLEAYRAITATLPRLLKPEGLAVLELGAGQAEAVTALAVQNGLKLLGLRRDLGAIERAIVLKNK